MAKPFNRAPEPTVLDPILTMWNLLFSWQRTPNDTAVAHLIGFPLLLAFALVMVMCGFRRDRFLVDSLARSDELTVTFALYSTLWVSAVTLLLSYSDHNRYRFMVSAFYCLFLALAVERALTQFWPSESARRLFRCLARTGPSVVLSTLLRHAPGWRVGQ